jgi:hypothetical protein
MTTVYIILTVCLTIFLGAAAFLVLIIVGVRKRDRIDLGVHPVNRIDAITCRVLGLGVRDGAGSEEGEK